MPFKQSIISFRSKLSKWKYATLLACTLFPLALKAQEKNLDFYIQEALLQSPLLKDYDNQILSNSTDSSLLRATYLPQVSANSINSYAPVINGWGYDEAITNGRNIYTGINVNQAIVGKKNLHTQLESIRLRSNGLKNTKALSEQDLKRTITAQYILAYGDEQQLSYLRETFDLLKSEDDLLKKLTQNNVYRQTDYLTFLVTLQQQELATKQAVVQLQNDIATLNYMTGIVDTAAIQLAEPVMEMPVLSGMKDESVFFKQYTYDSLSIINRMDLVRYNYKPKLSLYGDAGYNSSLAITPYKNFGFNVGFSLTVPIFDGRQKKKQFTKLAIEEDTRKNYKSFFSKQQEQQLAQLWQQLGSLQNLVNDIEHQVKYSDALIKANTKLLSTGDVRIADMIIALNNFLNAKNQLTQNKINRLYIINQINYWNR